MYIQYLFIHPSISVWGSPCIFFCQALESIISPRSLGSFYWRMAFGKIWTPVYSLLPIYYFQAHSVYRAGEYMSINTSMYIYFYTYSSVYLLKSLRLYWLWFQSSTAGLILAFFLSLSMASFSDNEKSDGHYPYLCSCSVLLYTKYSFSFANPYPCKKKKKANLMDGVQYLCT